MKKLLIWEILTHATLVLSAMFLTFVIIDRFNPAMEFIGSDVSDWFLLAFALCALVSSILSAMKIYRHKKQDYEKIQWHDKQK